MKIVLDIETLQASREHWERLMGVASSSKPSLAPPSPPDDLFEYSEYETQKRKEEELYQRSAFDGTFSQIIVIGVLVFSESMVPQQAIAWYGNNEAELLRQFWAKMNEIRPSLWVTHNGLGFDLPFLKKRSVIHQVKPPIDINLAKFRTEPVFDTMAIWSNWDMRGWVKLDVLARALQVPTKSGSGAQVAEMWRDAQGGKNVAMYCLQDTFVTYACYCRMTYRPYQSQDSVLSKAECIDVDGGEALR
jgi:3'-5' exonuclease